MIGILILIAFPKWVVDDFFIVARYADNFRQHGQLVWNLNEYFQGYTGSLLLFVLVVSPFGYVLTTHMIGVASYFLGMGSLYGMFSDRYLRGYSVISWLAAPALLTHVFSGLESLLFISLCLFCGLAWLRQKNWLLLVGLIMASLCRPEGVPFSAVMIYLMKERED